MIIDAHVHIMSVPSLKKSEEIVLESMRTHGINFCLMSNADCGEYQEFPANRKVSQYKGLQEALHFARNHKGKIGVLVWINPHNEVLDEKFKALIRNNRSLIYGLKIHPWDSRIKVTSHKLKPYLDFAKEEGFPVLIHTAADEYSDIKYVGKIAKIYPEVKFIAAHLQLCSDNLASLEVLKENPNVYGDTAWVNMEFAKRVLREIGNDRVMFGTDNPVDGIETLDNPMYQEYFQNGVGLDKETYADLMYRNAIKIYRLPNIKIRK
ncbi:MAG: amidohydrolase family protein [Bacilli bacterium]|nr:amidohydrolase family protein [Bacilli bacterium]